MNGSTEGLQIFRSSNPFFIKRDFGQENSTFGVILGLATTRSVSNFKREAGTTNVQVLGWEDAVSLVTLCSG